MKTRPGRLFPHPQTPDPHRSRGRAPQALQSLENHNDRNAMDTTQRSLVSFKNADNHDHTSGEERKTLPPVQGRRTGGRAIAPRCPCGGSRSRAGKRSPVEATSCSSASEAVQIRHIANPHFLASQERDDSPARPGKRVRKLRLRETPDLFKVGGFFVSGLQKVPLGGSTNPDGIKHTPPVSWLSKEWISRVR